MLSHFYPLKATQWVALEWDHQELRLVVAQPDAGGLRLRLVEGIALPPDEAPDRDEKIAAKIRGALGSRSGRSVPVVLVANRAAVDVCQLQLPPATDAELADMVIHQAIRDVSTITDESTVDYLPFSDDADQPRRVMAVAASGDYIGKLRQIARKARLQPKHLVLRPLASLSLVQRRRQPGERCYLVANQVAEGLDLTIVVDGQPLWMRSIRLPDGDAAAVQDRLIREIQRSLLAGPDEAVGESGGVEHVYLVGHSAANQQIADRITAELGVPASEVDIVAGTASTAAAADIDQARFGALVGALHDAGSIGRSGVDPTPSRRPPKPLNRRRLAIVAGAAAAMLLLVIAGLVRGQLTTADAEIARLTERRNDLDDNLRRYREQQELAEQMNLWQAAVINWLDEMRDLSIRMPSEHEIVFQRMTLASGRDRGGVVELQGQVRDPATIALMERRIRGEFHEIRSKNVQERVTDSGYTWYFESAISVRPRLPEQYLGPEMASHIEDSLTDEPFWLIHAGETYENDYFSRGDFKLLGGESESPGYDTAVGTVPQEPESS